MNQIEIIQKLKERAAKDPASNAVCHMWAQRERARSQVTTYGLAQRMRAEKFEFSEDDYNNFLKFISDIGLGKLEKLGKGKVMLKDVKVTLQSIGSAAVGMGQRLDKFTKRNQFSNLVQMSKDIKGAPDKKPVEFPVSLTIVINGKPVNFRIPGNLSPEEIADIVKRFQGTTVSS